MATLTTVQKLNIQRLLEKKVVTSGSSVRWTKPGINAAAQAIEDELTNIQGTVATAVNTATSPFGFTLTATEKKWLGAVVFYEKYIKDLG